MGGQVATVLPRRVLREIDGRTEIDRSVDKQSCHPWLCQKNETDIAAGPADFVDQRYGYRHVAEAERRATSTVFRDMAVPGMASSPSCHTAPGWWPGRCTFSSGGIPSRISCRTRCRRGAGIWLRSDPRAARGALQGVRHFSRWAGSASVREVCSRMCQILRARMERRSMAHAGLSVLMVASGSGVTFS